MAASGHATQSEFASSDLSSARNRKSLGRHTAKKEGGPHSASSLRDALLLATPDSVTTTTNRPDPVVAATCCPSRVNRRGQATPVMVHVPRPHTALAQQHGAVVVAPPALWPPCFELGTVCAARSRAAPGLWAPLRRREPGGPSRPIRSLAVGPGLSRGIRYASRQLRHLVHGPVARTKRNQKHKAPP